jgi:hypothetical protein
MSWGRPIPPPAMAAMIAAALSWREIDAAIAVNVDAEPRKIDDQPDLGIVGHARQDRGRGFEFVAEIDQDGRNVS